MKLKLDDAGHAVLKDGHPVYVHADGKEIPFDAAGTVATISRLNGEAKGHRERAEAAEEKLKGFEGLDVEAARNALEVVGKLDAKKLIDAGEVDKVRAEAQKAFDDKLLGVEKRYAPIVKDRDRLQAALIAERVGGSFARSKYIAEKLAIPVDLVQARFGHCFKLEDDKVIGYGPDGKQIFSRAKPGDVADFDEALEILVDAYPHRDSIVKGAGASGGGAGGGGGGNGGAGKQMTREAFHRLSPAEQQKHFKEGGSVVDAR